MREVSEANIEPLDAVIPEVHIPCTDGLAEQSRMPANSDGIVGEELLMEHDQSEPLDGDLASTHNISEEEQGSPNDSSEIIFEGHLADLSPGTLMTVPLDMLGHQVDALIDTGASRSLVTDEWVRQLCLPITTTGNQVITGLGGVRVTTLGVVPIQFKLGSLEFTSEFLVMPNTSMKHTIILGNNFFEHEGVIVDLAFNRLSGESPHGGTWEFYTQEDPVTVYRNAPIICARDVVLSLDEPTLIDINAPGISQSSDVDDLYYDGDLPKRHDGVLVAERGFLKTECGRSKILIEVIRKTDKPMKLKQGDHLGTVSTVLEVQIAASDTEETWSRERLEQDICLEQVSADQKESIMRMLLRQSDVLSCGELDIGCVGATEHRIEVHCDTPIRQKPRRFPEPVARAIEEQCQKLLELNVIEYSKSPWSSACVPVSKKDGSGVRLCIDYRQLNKVTKADRFPMPNLGDMVYGLHGNKYFTVIDMTKGFYQVPLHPDSRELTAFSTTQNHYQYKRLSFGLKNAPAAFQREMQTVLREFDRKQVVIYIDDVLMMSTTFEDHLLLVEKVLATLSNAGMKIKLNKCQWFNSEVTFLGHIVGKEGLRKADQYIADVQKFAKPDTVKDLRSFLGLVNFQRKFIPNCSMLSRPLTKWMGYTNKTKLQWDEAMQLAFDDLKEAMAQDILLSYPDYSPSAPKLQLATDACRYGAGGCLTQVQEGDTRVIGYASTTFNKAQVNYSTIEQELAAIRWAVQAFRGFLYGVTFILYTDHRPLVYMHNMAKQNSRLMRTWNDLSEFNFEVKYRAGKENNSRYLVAIR